MSDGTALSQSDQTMLRYALDLAQEQVWSGEGFTEDDQEALTSLRRLLEVEAPRETCGNQLFEWTCALPGGTHPYWRHADAEGHWWTQVRPV